MLLTEIGDEEYIPGRRKRNPVASRGMVAECVDVGVQCSEESIKEQKNLKERSSCEMGTQTSYGECGGVQAQHVHIEEAAPAKIRRRLQIEYVGNMIDEIVDMEWPEIAFEKTAVIEETAAELLARPAIAVVTMKEEENLARGLFRRLADRFPGAEENKPSHNEIVSLTNTTKSKNKTTTRTIILGHITGKLERGNALEIIKKIKEKCSATTLTT